MYIYTAKKGDNFEVTLTGKTLEFLHLYNVKTLKSYN